MSKRFYRAGALTDLLNELEEVLILRPRRRVRVRLWRAQGHCQDGKSRTAQKSKRIAEDTEAENKGSGEPLNLSTKPSVILVIGVNGVGKTTTIGKLAYLLKSEGKSVLLAAADTFRAAAADQLAIWAQRSGAMLVRHGEGADPAAVVFDSIKAGVARNVDVIICDTAGRLHNKANLMNELSKINRIIDRQLPGCAKEVLLVIDATTGQNALVQAAEFKQAAGVTGIVLTKLDGTAKGGIAIAICDSEKLPVRFVGVGEQVDDLMPFDADSFVDAMFD